GQLHARLGELPQVIIEIGRGGDQASGGAQVGRVERAVAGTRAATTVAVIDEHAEVLADHGQRHADFHDPAIARSLPGSADARLLHRGLAAELLRLDAPPAHRARPAAGEEQALLPAALVVKRQPYA